MTVHWTANASDSSSVSTYIDSGTSCTGGYDSIRYSAATNQSTVRWNGWYIEGSDEYGENYRIQFAHYPTAFPQYRVRKVKHTDINTPTTESDYNPFTHMPEIITVEYAPLEEMIEVEPTKFNEYLERLRTDPEYRRQQLAMQDRLFLSEKELGMWTVDGFNLLHRFLEHYHGGIDLPHARELILHLWEQAGALRMDGQMATEFMGVPARFEELASLREVFNKYPMELIREVYEKRKGMIESLEHLITREETQPKIPHLSPEQLKAIATNAERLLKEVLTPAEYDGLMKDGHVRIQSPNDPEVIYLVKRVPSERIEVHRKGKLAEKLCIYFKTELPDDDITLTKIMMLKQNEGELLKIANHFKVDAPTIQIENGHAVLTPLEVRAP